MPLSPHRTHKSKPVSRNPPEGTGLSQEQYEIHREVEHSIDSIISGGFMGFLAGTGRNCDSQGKPQGITLWAAEPFGHMLLTVYPHPIACKSRMQIKPCGLHQPGIPDTPLTSFPNQC